MSLTCFWFALDMPWARFRHVLDMLWPGYLLNFVDICHQLYGKVLLKKKEYCKLASLLYSKNKTDFSTFHLLRAKVRTLHTLIIALRVLYLADDGIWHGGRWRLSIVIKPYLAAHSHSCKATHSVQNTYY